MCQPRTPHTPFFIENGKRRGEDLVTWLVSWTIGSDEWRRCNVRVQVQVKYLRNVRVAGTVDHVIGGPAADWWPCGCLCSDPALRRRLIDAGGRTGRRRVFVFGLLTDWSRDRIRRRLIGASCVPSGSGADGRRLRNERNAEPAAGGTGRSRGRRLRVDENSNRPPSDGSHPPIGRSSHVTTRHPPPPDGRPQIEFNQTTFTWIVQTDQNGGRTQFFLKMNLKN